MSIGTTQPATPSFRGLLGKRRNFLVNKRYQLRASLLTAGIVLIALIFVNLAIYASTMTSAEGILSDAPELAAVIKAQDRVQLYLIVLASLVYLMGVFLITVLETHRTAGAAFNLGRSMGEIRQGRFSTRLRLRKGDNLLELESSFNAMVESLQDRARSDVETLVRLADEADKLHDTDRGRRLAEQLRGVADERRKLVE